MKENLYLFWYVIDKMDPIRDPYSSMSKRSIVEKKSIYQETLQAIVLI